MSDEHGSGDGSGRASEGGAPGFGAFIGARDAVGSRDLAEWRDTARGLLRDGVEPGAVTWIDPDEPQGLLRSAAPADVAGERGVGGGCVAGGRVGRAVRVPPEFLELAQVALCHRDVRTWDVLYRVLWRLTRGEPRLLKDPADEDVHALHQMVKAVRRDAHKMKAFVRFRRVVAGPDDAGGPEHYIAFHRPDHRIIRLVAPFFARRFSVMRWTILTPTGSATWDGEAITYGPPASRRNAPSEDALEELWRSYYSSVFNPARVNVRAMQREMPVRYWGTLPEASIIDELLRSAPGRVDTMLGSKVGGGDAGATGAEAFVPKGVPLSIPVLRAAAATCRGCPLYERGTQTVFGEGGEHARIVLVGEQPGDQEDRQGRPFVGPAGEVLDRALVEAGIERDEVYVTNAVKHFKWVPDPRGKRRIHSKPSALEARACLAWLQHELELIKPRVIVPLGATAGQSMLGASFRVTASRGRVLGDTAFAPALVVATIHPSAILRMPDEAAKTQGFAELVSDLKLAKQAATT